MATNGSEPEIDPDNNPVVKFLSRYMPITSKIEDGRFFVRKENLLFATPLFVVLVMVETTDVVFAADSIPAILAVSRDTFIVYTSNVFALLGLRALYFALEGLMRLFHYLHYGLSLILIFIGFKLLVTDYIHIPMAISLGVVGFILAVSVIVSLVLPKKEKEDTLPLPK
jgi:tellurite resistance protein TerC